jgi:hypothetical protein
MASMRTETNPNRLTTPDAVIRADEVVPGMFLLTHLSPFEANVIRQAIIVRHIGDDIEIVFTDNREVTTSIGNTFITFGLSAPEVKR